jgi:leucyl aminopeptidase
MCEILLAENAASGKTTINIVSQDTTLNDFGLSDAEKEYIFGSVANKNFTITINKYSHWLIFLFIEERKTSSISNEALRLAAFQIHKMLSKYKISELQIVNSSDNENPLLAFIEGLLLSNYQFIKYFKNKEERTFSLTKIEVIAQGLNNSRIEEVKHLCKAVGFVRDMVNEPASYLTSTKLSEEIQRLGNESGFKVDVFNKSKIEELKMGGILAVNKGSIEPPTFTVMTWKPENAVNKKPYILVGKGIVYDSGGLSLKPTPDSMDYMKCDMAGAAAVAGTMYALAKNNVPIYAIALAPSTDNRLDALSYSPGDVITMYDGTTVEVLNTDAEGRLILADALSYAKQFDPELVISIATLTGSAHKAIGDLGMAGMGNADASTFSKLEESGWKVYERVARLPFWDEYAEMIKSDIADLKNIGGDSAGAITAGKFLEYFTDYPYIHLDIAGVAFLKRGNTYKGKGATGVGTRLLYSFLNQLTNKA